MYLDSGGNRPSLTPQLAMRVAILGGIALLFFALIFFRLWYLQVLSGDNYRAEANDNRVRAITVQAPRGEIVDRDGNTLVENRVGLAVKVSPKELPEARAQRRDLYRRLAEALQMRPRRIERRVEKQLREIPYSTAVVKEDVDQAVVAYLLENQDDFPGVEPEQVFLRDYPHGDVGAHLFGYTGEVTPEQLEDKTLPGRGRRRSRGRRRDRGRVRPLPARAQRRDAGAGRCDGGAARPSVARAPAEAGTPAAAVARPRRAEGRSVGAGGWAERGRLRRDERPQRRRPRAGQHADLRPQSLHAGDQYRRLRAAAVRGGWLSAQQSRHHERLSDRLHVQAHHRHGRARGRPDHARDAGQRPGLVHRRHPGLQQRRRRRARRGRTCARRSRSPATSTSTSSVCRRTTPATGC